MSLPKKNRLKKKELFKKIKQSGQLIRTPFFNILFLRQDGVDLPKIGVIVSKKIDKSAVVRNKIKRKVLVSVKEVIDKFNQNLLVLFLIKHPAKIASKKEIGQTIFSQKQLFKISAEKLR